MQGESDASQIIATIRREVEQAADALLSAAERGLRGVGEVRTGQVAALDDVESALCTILETCAFQDLTGQRLSKLNSMIRPAGLRAIPVDPLLNGPALPGEGLSQHAADRLFNDTL